MSNLKRLAACALVLTLMLSVMPCFAYAETNATISLSNAKSARGKNAAITLNMANNPGVAVLKLRIGFDDTKFTLTNIADTGILGNAVIDNSASKLISSPAVLLWEKAASSKQMTSNGKIAVLTFNIKEDTPDGDYPVTVSISYGDAVNTDGNVVEYNTVAGIITVADVIYGDVNDDGRVNSIDAFALLRYLADWDGYSEINEAASDVNGDGKVDIKDGTVLLRYLANWSDYKVLPHETVNQPAIRPVAVYDVYTDVSGTGISIYNLNNALEQDIYTTDKAKAFCLSNNLSHQNLYSITLLDGKIDSMDFVSPSLAFTSGVTYYDANEMAITIADTIYNVSSDWIAVLYNNFQCRLEKCNAADLIQAGGPVKLYDIDGDNIYDIVLAY